MLSDLEIKRLLLTGGLKIEPFDSRRLGPVSYDILTELQDWDKNMARLRSVETFTLPRNILGICSLRSRATHMEEIFASFSNLIDPGYSGKLIFLVYSPTEQLHCFKREANRIHNSLSKERIQRCHNQN